MKMKEGDFITEEELEKEGWVYKYHISGGVHAFRKDDQVLFWSRSSQQIESIFDYIRFNPP